MGREAKVTETPLVTEPETQSSLCLMDVPLGKTFEVDRIDVESQQAAPLLERGIVPGSRIRRVQNSPSGDPIVSVGGALFAIRRECAEVFFVHEVEEA